MGLSAVQQAFLQALLAKKAIPNRDGVKLYNHCVDLSNGSKARKVTTDSEFDALKAKINKSLASLELRIQTAYSPWEEATFIGVVNTLEDDAARLGTYYHKTDIGLFYAIIDELRESGGAVRTADAQSFYLEGRSTATGNTRIITRLCDDHWLRGVRTDNTAMLVPGPRALLELPRVRNWARGLGKVEREEEAQDEMLVEEEEGPVRGRKRRAVVEEEEEEEEEEEIVRPVSQSRRRASRR